MKTKNTFLLFLVAVVDFLGLGVIMAAFAPLFMAQQHGIFLQAVSHDVRFYWLGVAFAAAPLGQLFSTPLFGSYSDKLGRRPLLLLSLSGTCLSTLLSALAIAHQSLFLLIVSRLLVGVFSGNIVVAQGALADMTPVSKNKPWTFNFLQVGIGFGMLFGPMLGGKLLNTSSAAGFATPFYWSFAASVAVLLLVAFFFSETRQADNKLATSPVEAFAGFKRIAYVFQIKGIRRLLIAWVVFMLGWDFYMQYFSNYLLGVLHFDPNQIGNFFSYLGIAYLVAQIAIVQPSTRFFSAKKMLVPAGVVVAACIFAIGLVESVSLVYLLITIYIVAIGLFIPNFNAMLSDRADQQHQGVAFGACVSLHALTTLTMALIGGVLLTFSLRLPLVGGGILIFLGCIIFYCFTRRNSAESK